MILPACFREIYWSEDYGIDFLKQSRGCPKPFFDNTHECRFFREYFLYKCPPCF